MKRKSIYYSLDTQDTKIDSENILKYFSSVLSLIEFAIGMSNFVGEIEVIVGSFKFLPHEEICLKLYPMINILIYGQDTNTLAGLIESSLVDINPEPINLEKFEHPETVFSPINKRLLNKLSYRNHRIRVKSTDDGRIAISSRTIKL